jgi:benzoyl-CoA reductase subunit C
MIAGFYEAVRQIDCPPVVDWKAGGKRVVGYTCSYVPGEIFHAAGILPVRLRGIGTTSTRIGDAYFGPYICSFPKCILQLAGEGRFDFLDGTVITPGCDSMRRLDECWRKAGDDHPGIVPGFFYYFDVPHKTEPHGTAWFEEEIRNLIRAVETRFNVCITPGKLQASIVLFNKGRDLLARMEALRSARPGAISGADAFAVAVAGTVMPREDYTRQLADYLAAVSDRGKSNVQKARNA